MTPKTWENVKFSDIASFKYGKMPTKNKILETGGYPIYSGYRYVGYYNEYNIDKNTLIIIARGVGGTGDVKLTKEKCYLTNLSIAVFPFNNNSVNTLYLYYYFLLHNLRYLDSGSAQSQITISDLEKLVIKLPPLETQKKIAVVLSSLDDKIELNNKINQNLEQQAQEIYNQLILTQELKEKTLSEIIEITDGTHDSPKVKEDGYYLITSKHLSKYGINKDNANYISEEDFNKINERSKVDKYDILMSMIGTVGLVSLIIEDDIDFAVKNVGIFKTSLQKDYIYFIFSYLLSSSTQNYVKSHLAGTTQKYISLGELRNLKIKLPNKKILASFNELVYPIYQKIINNTNEIKILTQLRGTLLPKLMSGEIDVDKVEV